MPDGSLNLNFHEGQRRATASKKRFILVLAGSQSGKTSYAPWWLNREIYGGEDPYTGEYVEGRGPGDYLAVTSTYDLFKLKMLPEMKLVFENILGMGRWVAGDKIFELADPDGEFWSERKTGEMWGRIILRSASAEGGLESATANAAWLDEAGQDEFTLEAWEAVRRRLSLAMGRVLITTTPYNLGWLLQKIYKPWKDGDPIAVETTDVVQFPSIANPAFPMEEFEEREATMQEWKFRMFYLGEFTKPAGMIYKDLIDRMVETGGHRIRPFQIPPSWPRYVGIDPGAVNMATVWLAKDPQTGIYYLYRATKEETASTPEHARKMLELAAEDRAMPEGWWIGAKPESQQRLDWEAAGIEDVYEPPFSDVEAGIDKVVSLIRPFNMFIFDNLDAWWDEAMRYSRVLDEMSEPIEEIKDKKKFHLMDAMRYAVVGAEDEPGELVEDDAPEILRYPTRQSRREAMFTRRELAMQTAASLPQIEIIEDVA